LKGGSDWVQEFDHLESAELAKRALMPLLIAGAGIDSDGIVGRKLLCGSK